MSEPTIDLYTAQTPNGIKISILLECLGLPYRVHSLSFKDAEQKTAEFLKINPNGRIPAITDTRPDGQKIRVFESGSIMLYLVATYDKEYRFSFPAGSPDHIEMMNWLFWMNAGLGPMQGQSNHFYRYAPEKIEYAINRYRTESARLYGVLEQHLADSSNDFIVGNKFSIVDMAIWGWVASSAWSGVDVKQFPRLTKWRQRVLEIPAVERGRHVPSKHGILELENDPEALEKKVKETSGWVLAGQKQDQAKYSNK